MTSTTPTTTTLYPVASTWMSARQNELASRPPRLTWGRSGPELVVFALLAVLAAVVGSALIAHRASICTPVVQEAASVPADQGVVPGQSPSAPVVVAGHVYLDPGICAADGGSRHCCGVDRSYLELRLSGAAHADLFRITLDDGRAVFVRPLSSLERTTGATPEQAAENSPSYNEAGDAAGSAADSAGAPTKTLRTLAYPRTLPARIRLEALNETGFRSESVTITVNELTPAPLAAPAAPAPVR